MFISLLQRTPLQVAEENGHKSVVTRLFQVSTLDYTDTRLI